MWVGSFRSCVSPYGDVKLSSLAPSGVVLSVEYDLLKLALKSSMMTVRKGFIVWVPQALNLSYRKNPQIHH